MKSKTKTKLVMESAERPGGVSRRHFLISLLMASGAVVMGPGSLLQAAPGAAAVGWKEGWPTQSVPLITDLHERVVKLYTELSLKHLTETTPHWGIGYRGGKLAHKFILVSPADPVHFHDALIRIGARAGNNLSPDDYGKYTDGDELSVSAQWPGLSRPAPLGEIFFDDAGKGFMIRFGGNRDIARDQGTGCLTCLESCPVGITSNSLYPHLSSIGRMIRPSSRFRGRPEVLPQKDSFPVMVSYRLSGKG